MSAPGETGSEGKIHSLDLQEQTHRYKLKFLIKGFYNYTKFSDVPYIAIWVLLLLWFWIGLSPDGAMAYSIISFYLVLPISSFAISCGLRTKNIWIKGLSPVFFGCMAMMLGFLTFDLANTLTFQNQHIPDFKMALASAIPSLTGLCVSAGVTALKKKKG